MSRMEGTEFEVGARSNTIASGALAAAVAVAASFLVLVAGHPAGADDGTVPVTDRREAVLPELPVTGATLPEQRAGDAPVE